MTLVGAIVVPWQSVAAYYPWTGRIDAGFHYPPLGLVISLLLLGLMMLVGGYWASRGS